MASGLFFTDKNNNNIIFEKSLDAIINTIMHPDADHIANYVLNDRIDLEVRKKNLQALNDFVISGLAGIFNAAEKSELNILDILPVLMKKVIDASKSPDIPVEIRQTLIAFSIDVFDAHTKEISDSWKTAKGDDWQLKDYYDSYIEGLILLKITDDAAENAKTNKPLIPKEINPNQFNDPVKINKFLKDISKIHPHKNITNNNSFGAFIKETLKEQPEIIKDFIEVFKQKSQKMIMHKPSFKRRSSR